MGVIKFTMVCHLPYMYFTPKWVKIGIVVLDKKIPYVTLEPTAINYLSDSGDQKKEILHLCSKRVVTSVDTM